MYQLEFRWWKSMRAAPRSGLEVGLAICLTFSAALHGCGTHTESGFFGPEESQFSSPLLYQPSLGVGVDFSETRTYRRCVTLPITSARHAFSSRLYDELTIRSRQDLNIALGIDGSMSAKGLWGGAGGTAAYFKNVNMSADAFYWLVHANYKLLDRGLDTGDPTFDLIEQAKEILAGPRGLDGFREACGDFFYSGSQLGAHYALLYEFRSHEESTIDRIRADANYAGWGIEAKATFEHLMQLAQRASVLKIHSASEGGSDRLKAYASNPGQLEEQLALLRDELYRENKGVEAQWFMSDYSMFPAVQAAKSLAEKSAADVPAAITRMAKSHALSRLYDHYAENISYRKQLMGLLEKSVGTEPLYWYAPSSRAKIDKAIDKIDTNVMEIEARAKECLNGKEADCKFQDLLKFRLGEDADPVSLAAPDQDFTTLQGWTIDLLPTPFSGHHLQFIGHPPGEDRVQSFYAGFSLSDSPLGVMARANEGQEKAVVIGEKI